MKAKNTSRMWVELTCADPRVVFRGEWPGVERPDEIVALASPSSTTTWVLPSGSSGLAAPACPESLDEDLEGLLSGWIDGEEFHHHSTPNG